MSTNSIKSRMTSDQGCGNRITEWGQGISNTTEGRDTVLELNDNEAVKLAKMRARIVQSHRYTAPLPSSVQIIFTLKVVPGIIGNLERVARN